MLINTHGLLRCSTPVQLTAYAVPMAGTRATAQGPIDYSTAVALRQDAQALGHPKVSLQLFASATALVIFRSPETFLSFSIDSFDL